MITEDLLAGNRGWRSAESIIVTGLPIVGIFGRLKLKPKGKPARD
jgi:hypothetical protein